ncbi:DUF2207 domain-containing protein [Nocardioides mangrovicus]|uniref:DUF2207 domain-containing protein n=1 Tax=Nocardioides mangrovicus TaxID=2478913 RepID=UPI0018E06CE7|nr:DUF2207 domain-containing protein [Nocardioides mangrovicus]
MKRLVGSVLGLAVVVLLVIAPALFNADGGSSDATSTTDPATISNYQAQFQVDRDGTLRATETLLVNFSTPRHGIFRFFDTVDAANDRVRLVPHDIRVTRDGEADGLELSHEDGGRYVVAKIGDADQTLTGQHTYVITYEVPKVLADDGDASQFYWNLIPSGWQMSIGASQLTATLPAAPQQVQCARGVGASQGCTATVSGRTLRVTTSSLAPHTPVTIKTTVAVAPPGQDTLPWSRRLEPVLGHSVVALVLVLLLAAAALAAGLAMGRTAHEDDPAFPLMYAPPEGIGPAEGAYLLTEKVTDDMYAASILQLGEKGLVSLDGRDDGWTITGTKGGDWSKADVLTQQVAGALGITGQGSTFTAHKKDTDAGETLKAARRGFNGAVSGWAISNGLMVRRGVVQLGAVLSLVAFVVLLFMCFANPFEMSAVGLPFGAFAVAAAPLRRTGASTIRTAEGRDVWSKVGGFRRVIGTPSSEQRFDFSGRKELYTQYIPWAVAFGVADVWAEKYRVEMQADPPVPGYFLGGYYAGSAGGFSGASFSDSFNSSMQSAISSYEATQSSSSGGGGFGGGGFSGGGGGGGGGGGSW